MSAIHFQLVDGRLVFGRQEAERSRPWPGSFGQAVAALGEHHRQVAHHPGAGPSRAPRPRGELADRACGAGGVATSGHSGSVVSGTIALGSAAACFST
jgi:hypothetical protein